MICTKVSINMGNSKDMGGTFGHVACFILDFGKMAKEMVKAPNSKKTDLLKSKEFGRMIN